MTFQLPSQVPMDFATTALFWENNSFSQFNMLLRAHLTLLWLWSTHWVCEVVPGRGRPIIGLADYQGRYSAFYRLSVSAFFLNQIADTTLALMRPFLWLQSPLFTSNVPPTALSERLLLKCQSTLKIFRGRTFSDYRQVRRTRTQTEASSSSERCFECKSVESRSSINIPIPYAEVAKTPRSYDPILSVC